MSDMAAQLVQARLNEVQARISVRVEEISASTGISFSQMFSQITAADSTNATAGGAKSSGLGSAVIGLLGLGSDSDSSGSSADLGSLSSMLGLNTTSSTDQLLALLEKLGNGVTVGSAEKPGLVGGTRAEYEEIVKTVAARYGLSPVLLDAVVQAESDYDAACVSTAGAVGLMQLMPNTAAGLGVKDSYDPEENVDGGARYLLAQIIRYNGDVKTALAAYNCGPYGLSKRGVDNVHDPDQFAKLPKETQMYLTNIERILTQAGYPNLLNENFYA